MAIQRFGVYRVGSVVHAPVVKAGNWVLGTGLRAVGGDGIVVSDVARLSRPLDPPPRPEREAGRIFWAIEQYFQAAETSLSRVVRLDQYYSAWQAVDPYHSVRKAAFRGSVPPSTSILVGGLLNTDAGMDVQVMAITASGSLEVTRAVPPGAGVPEESGYSPCVRAGDLLFVAGQLARDALGNIAEAARVPAGQLWRGTRIKLETGYVIRQRLAPLLSASGSDLDLILKAQVYLGCECDLPAFWQVWRSAFPGPAPPTTIIPVSPPAFGTRDATLEINVIAAHRDARHRIEDIRCDVDLVCPDMLPARRFDDLLFVAGLMAIGPEGLVESARVRPTAPYFCDTVAAQMADILGKARKIFAAAGTGLDNVIRALHFQTRLNGFASVYEQWRQAIGDSGLPFSAVQVHPSLFVPGAELIVDLFGYVPRR
ncbi:MAG: RidA family protein [Acetobacteraceae bacterium]